jgi:hypothetical protein
VNLCGRVTENGPSLCPFLFPHHHSLIVGMMVKKKRESVIERQERESVIRFHFLADQSLTLQVPCAKASP